MAVLNEKPASRRQPMTALWFSRLAGPGLRVSISPMAQLWRFSASRAEIARPRIADLQSSPIAGDSISPKTMSTMPSSSSSLLATCL